jgi:hypothetical protein
MNYSDIKLEIDDICDSTDTSFPVATKLRRVNSALEEIVGEIIEVNGDFQFDDSNFTDLPEGKATLVNGQKDYSFDVTFLDILGVSVKDTNGVYQALLPIDQRDMTQNMGNVSGIRVTTSTQRVDPTQFYPTNGMPIFYDKKGGSVYLYPTPATGSVTLVDGLKVFFQRTAHLFELADTTAVPGFISTYHRIIPLMASLSYNRKYHADRVPAMLVEIQDLKRALLERYAKRSKDEVKRFGVRQESCR